MSDADGMDSDNETFLPASQSIEQENGKESGPPQESSQTASVGQETNQAGKSTRQKKAKEKEKEPAGTVQKALFSVQSVLFGATCRAPAYQKKL